MCKAFVFPLVHQAIVKVTSLWCIIIIIIWNREIIINYYYSLGQIVILLNYGFLFNELFEFIKIYNV